MTIGLPTKNNYWRRGREHRKYSAIDSLALKDAHMSS